MNPHLKEINDIIALCDDMIVNISKLGDIHPGNQIYAEYRKKIYAFLKGHGLIRKDYVAYEVLNLFYYYDRAPFSLNLNEVSLIRKTIIDIKHELFPNCFDKIFISHREKNRDQVSAFMELLYSIGIPKPIAAHDEQTIFCTSHPATYIENRKKNLEEIRKQFASSDHTLFILWYTDEYFASQACLNEMGAIWATNKTYQEILFPGFDSNKIGGLLDRQAVWFVANDKFRLNSFKEDLERMFGLPPIRQNYWEVVRDNYIEQINRIALQGGGNNV